MHAEKKAILFPSFNLTASARNQMTHEDDRIQIRMEELGWIYGSLSLGLGKRMAMRRETPLVPTLQREHFPDEMDSEYAFIRYFSAREVEEGTYHLLCSESNLVSYALKN